jgi:hypothetical protein
MLRALLAFAGFSLASSIDTVGSSGCTAPACVFANANLRFGTGLQTSVNSQGLFVQPWYYSHTANSWYKLTFADYPLDTAIGTGYSGTNWARVSVVDLYSLPVSNPVTDYSGFIVSSSDATKSVGYGTIVANRTITVFGQTLVLQNRFSLGLTDSFVKIVTTIINIGTSQINNAIIWTGTRDDFVGNTDVNTKTRGNLNTGSFVAVTANNQSSRAIMITNTNEGVLFYSETTGVMTSYALCCAFANAYNTNPLSLAPMTPTPTDGSYAAVLPLGNVSQDGSGSITWYYAAGAISSLSTVAQNVAAAQVADSGGAVSETPTPSASLTPSSTTTISTTATMSATATMSSTPTPTLTPTLTPTNTASATSSTTLTTSDTPSTTITVSPTASQTASSTSSFPIRVIIAQAPVQQFNMTEFIHVVTVENTGQALLYIVGFVPILTVLLTVCCVGMCATCYLIKKNRKKRFEHLTHVTRVAEPDHIPQDEPVFRMVDRHEPKNTVEEKMAKINEIKLALRDL